MKEDYILKIVFCMHKSHHIYSVRAHKCPVNLLRMSAWLTQHTMTHEWYFLHLGGLYFNLVMMKNQWVVVALTHTHIYIYVYVDLGENIVDKLQ